MTDYRGSDAFIEVLNSYGVSRLFFNPGIENAGLMEAISKYTDEGKKAPSHILCLDEFVAMTAAHGHYMASGQPQVVVVHSELGTQQIGGALHNAQWGRVPVVFCAEPLGPEERVNWRGESNDQGSIVRACVKWDYQMKEDEDIRSVLQKAFEIATTEPHGPVYLTIPRFYYQKDLPLQAPPFSGTSLDLTETETPPGTLETIASVLLKAETPLIVTGYSGRNPESVSALVTLAESIGARVKLADIRMNFPSHHPLVTFQPPEANDGFRDPFIEAADVILAIDYDAHYAAPPGNPSDTATIIHLDMDLKKRGQPVWGRQPDIAVHANSKQMLPELSRLIQESCQPAQTEQIKARLQTIETEHLSSQRKWNELALDQSTQKPISPEWLCACVNDVITEDTIIVNQVITPGAAVGHQIHLDNPGSLLSCAGGCIGWPLAAAAGVKMAKPDKTVIALLGDGAFVYGCPVASLWTAFFYKSPFMAVIFNNQSYSAIKGLFKEQYDVDNMGADMFLQPDFSQVASACGAFGLSVTEPDQIKSALVEGLRQVENGQTAVIDVKIG